MKLLGGNWCFEAKSPFFDLKKNARSCKISTYYTVKV
jgi:hypothetical protein